MTSHERNDDEQWEDIVRRLGGTQDQAQTQPPLNPSDHEPDVQPASPLQGPRDYRPTDENMEDFKPPEPKAIASGNPRTVLSWFGIIGAVSIWILAALMRWPLPRWLTGVTLIGCLGGALSLFFLLPKTLAHREPFDDDDYGNGAKL